MAITDLVRVGAEVLDASSSEKTPLYYSDLFTGYYYVRYREYIAFYRVEEDKMHVDRVLFARSDYMKTLFKEM